MLLKILKILEYIDNMLLNILEFIEKTTGIKVTLFYVLIYFLLIIPEVYILYPIEKEVFLGLVIINIYLTASIDFVIRRVFKK